MSLREFGVNYVETRGIDAGFALMLGIDETEPHPETIESRLNFRLTPEQVKEAFKEVTSLLWFPIPRDDGFVHYVARVNGVYLNGEGEAIRFLYTKCGRRVPWIPGPVRDAAKEPDKPFICTEGFFKGATLLHAGGPVISFNGPWINEPVSNEEKEKPNNRVLVRELDGWRWQTRRVYFAFDLDQTANRNVRHAVIRSWILLKVAGAEVYQLCWDRQDKGIDDHLARLCGTDPVKQKSVLEGLIAEARPFIDSLVKGSGGDARLVREELRKVKMDVTDREAFAREVAGPLGVTKKSLLQGDKTAKSAQAKILFPEIESWDTPVDGNTLLADVQALIKKHIYIAEDDLLTVGLWVFWVLPGSRILHRSKPISCYHFAG